MNRHTHAFQVRPPSLVSQQGFAFLLFSYLTVFFLLSLTTTLLVRSSMDLRAAERQVAMSQAFWGAESSVDQAVRTLLAAEPPALEVDACVEDFTTLQLPALQGSTTLCLESEDDSGNLLTRVFLIEATGTSAGNSQTLQSVVEHSIQTMQLDHVVYVLDDLDLISSAVGGIDTVAAPGSLLVQGKGDLANQHQGLLQGGSTPVSLTGSIVEGDVYVNWTEGEGPPPGPIVEGDVYGNWTEGGGSPPGPAPGGGGSPPGGPGGDIESPGGLQGPQDLVTMDAESQVGSVKVLTALVPFPEVEFAPEDADEMPLPPPDEGGDPMDGDGSRATDEVTVLPDITADGSQEHNVCLEPGNYYIEHLDVIHPMAEVCTTGEVTLLVAHLTVTAGELYGQAAGSPAYADLYSPANLRVFILEEAQFGEGIPEEIAGMGEGQEVGDMPPPPAAGFTDALVAAIVVGQDLDLSFSNTTFVGGIMGKALMAYQSVLLYDTSLQGQQFPVPGTSQVSQSWWANLHPVTAPPLSLPGKKQSDSPPVVKGQAPATDLN